MDQVIQQAGDFLQTLNWVDYVIVIGVLRGVLVGYKSGGFVELIRAVVLLLTLAVLVAFTATLAAYIQGHTLLSAELSEKAVIILLGAITYMVLKLITDFILKFASMENNWPMKILGMALGGLRWAVLMSFVLYVISALQMPVVGSDVLQGSRWGAQLQPLAPSIIEFATGVVPRAMLDLK